jgi:hypothetical protein
VIGGVIVAKSNSDAFIKIPETCIEVKFPEISNAAC